MEDSQTLTINNGLLTWAIFIAQGFAVLSTIVGSLLYIYQDNLLYMPNPPGLTKTPEENQRGCRNPGEWTINGRQSSSRGSGSGSSIPYEDVMLRTSDGKDIHAWLLLQPVPETRPTLIYFHGNAANMGFRLQNAAEMYAAVGINILMMDYRGYGKSTGIPTEQGLNLDAKTVLDFVSKHPKLKGSPIVAFGRSLGGAVSISLAHAYPNLVKGVILENSFLSISAMVDVLMPLVSRLKFLILRIKWDSDYKIKILKQPIMFISGDSDQLVPPFHMKKLHELATNSVFKDFFNVSGGTHNDTWNVAGKEYYKRMKLFLEKSFGNNICATDKIFDNDKNDNRNNIALPTMTTNFQVK